VHLDGELPGRDQDQRPHMTCRLGEALHQRQAEGRGLARARAGASDQVAVAFEQEGNRQDLDRSRFLESLLLQKGESFLAEPEGLETRDVGGRGIVDCDGWNLPYGGFA